MLGQQILDIIIYRFIFFRWFELKTGGRISHFYEHPISEEVQMIFANALTFSGMWDRQFIAEHTKT